MHYDSTINIAQPEFTCGTARTFAFNQGDNFKAGKSAELASQAARRPGKPAAERPGNQAAGQLGSRLARLTNRRTTRQPGSMAAILPGSKTGILAGSWITGRSGARRPSACTMAVPGGGRHTARHGQARKQAKPNFESGGGCFNSGANASHSWVVQKAVPAVLHGACAEDKATTARWSQTNPCKLYAVSGVAPRF